MQKISKLAIVYILYGIGLALLMFLFRGVDIQTLALFAIGMALGLVLPLFLDVLVPHLQKGTASFDPSFLRSMTKEGMQSVTKGPALQPTEHTPLRSYPVLIGVILTGFFVISTTQGWFGKGVVLGFGFALIADLVSSCGNKQLLRSRWFSYFQTRLQDVELDIFVSIFVVIFSILTVLSVLV